MHAELLGLLPRLVSNVWVMKSHLGHIDHDVVKWITSKGIPGYEFLNGLLNYSPEEVLGNSAILAAQEAEFRLRPNLKSFYIDYTEHNIDILPLMEANMQSLMIEILSRLKLVNQEIDRYHFYFEKTFDPKSFTGPNEHIINANLDSSIKFISKNLMKIGDKITDILLMVKKRDYNNLPIKLKDIFLKINNFIKQKRF